MKTLKNFKSNYIQFRSKQEESGEPNIFVTFVDPADGRVMEETYFEVPNEDESIMTSTILDMWDEYFGHPWTPSEIN